MIIQNLYPKKIRPLHDIDLARIAPMTLMEKYAACRKMKFGGHPPTYKPFHRNTAQILNISTDMFPDRPREALERIKKNILETAKTGEQKMNLDVAEGCYDFAEDNAISGWHREFALFNVNDFKKTRYWLPYVLKVSDTPTIAYLDPRKDNGLTQVACKFVFSVMHQQIRVREGRDYSDVQLAIVQFGDGPGKRAARFIPYTEGDELFSEAAIHTMIDEAYQVWRDVLSERDADRRRDDDIAKADVFKPETPKQRRRRVVPKDGSWPLSSRRNPNFKKSA